MALRVFYPTIRVVRRQPRWWFDDFDSLLFSPRFAVRSPLWEFERILAEETEPSKCVPGTSKDGALKAAATKEETAETTSQDKAEKKPFAVKFQLSGFKPDQIKVKTLGQKLVVDAEHEERGEEDGIQSYSKKYYHQSIVLPENVRPEDVTSVLSKEGILSVTAPLLPLRAPEEEVKEVKVESEAAALEEEQSITAEASASSEATPPSDESPKDETN